MATFSSGVKCFRSFLIRSLRYLNGRTLSPFPAEAGHDQVLYAFEKIFEDLRGNREIAMGTWGAEQLQSSLDRCESLLKERGMNLDTYDSIKYRYDEIRYPLGELIKFFDSRESDISNRETAIVFAEALRGHFSELMDIAKEIDDEYDSSRSPRWRSERISSSEEKWLQG